MNSQIETQTSNHAVSMDLSGTMQDSTLSLHQQEQYVLHQHGLCAHITVFDLTQVHATPTALLAIKRAYLTEPYLVEQYANHYVGTLFRAANRGKDKGLLILDPTASTYVHRLSNGSELIVQGKTVEVNGAFTRRLTISCSNQPMQGGLQ